MSYLRREILLIVCMIIPISKLFRNVSYIKNAITRNPFFLHFIFSLHGICNIRHISLSCDIIWSMNIEICQASPGYLHMFLNISISFTAIMQNFPVNRIFFFFIFSVSTASKVLSFTLIITFVSCQLQAKYNNYLFDSPLSYHYFLSLMSSYENFLLQFSKDFFIVVCGSLTIIVVELLPIYGILD